MEVRARVRERAKYICIYIYIRGGGRAFISGIFPARRNLNILNSRMREKQVVIGMPREGNKKNGSS